MRAPQKYFYALHACNERPYQVQCCMTMTHFLSAIATENVSTLEHLKKLLLYPLKNSKLNSNRTTYCK